MKNTSLLEKLVSETSISHKQAIDVLYIISDFAKAKLPILEGTINSFIKEEIKGNDDNKN